MGKRLNKTGIARIIKRVRLRMREWPFFFLFHVWNHPIRGYRVFCRLKNKYGDNCRIYINHYPGTGDVFITSMLLPAWLAHRNDGSVPVVTVVNKSGLRIAKLFPLENVEILTQRETNALIRFYIFCGKSAELPIEIMHYHATAMITGILDRLNSYNSMDFMRFYLDIVFPGLNLGDITKAAFHYDTKDMDRFLEENGLRRGRTVILAPVANTIDKLSGAFWRYLAYRLQRKGYTVCTNIGSDAEKAVEGTKGIFVPFVDLPCFVEACGALIQLRSGLTDVISGTVCRKIILYPIENHYQFGRGSLKDFFSLKAMGLTDNAEEYEFSRSSERSVCERIVNSFPDI